jgi:hypothetical protein
VNAPRTAPSSEVRGSVAGGNISGAAGDPYQLVPRVTTGAGSAAGTVVLLWRLSPPQ